MAETRAAFRPEIVPSLLAARASMVAILVVRTTDAMGSPAPWWPSIATSSGQRRLAAAVIIRTQRRSREPPRLAATTRAGRRCWIGHSTQGNGTAITSHRSKRGITLGIGFGGPFVETGEGVVLGQGSLDRAQEHAAVLDRVADLIAGADAQGRAHLLGHDGLALDAQSGRYEPAFVCSSLTHGRNSIPSGEDVKARTSDQPSSFVRSTWLTIWGLAWPSVAFITWPTNQPKTLGLFLSFST